MTRIGPYPLDRVILCSPDASPHSQVEDHGPAEYFFPGANWVAHIRYVARDLGCRFVILTRPYGIVDARDDIWHYDLNLFASRLNPPLMRSIWRTMIPRKIDSKKCDIVVLYCGGVSRQDYIPPLEPILQNLRVDLLIFGGPPRYDLGKTKYVVEMLVRGTSLEEISDILRAPSYLRFYPATGSGDHLSTARLTSNTER